MKLAIAIISTGNYNKLSDVLISSIKTFLKNADIFLFTDVLRNDTKSFKIQDEEWPFVTLKRFDILREMYRYKKEYDFILYLDADMEIVEDIPEVVFNSLNSKYVGVSHPANYIYRNFWPVETNRLSTAFLDPNNAGLYCQGCLWGATSESFEEMNESLRSGVQKDLENNIVAIWHDESHLNRFFNENSSDLRVLTPSFAYPENWHLPLPKIIIHKDKNMIDYPRFQGVKSLEI